MTLKQLSQLEALVWRFGFRFSTGDVTAAGVPESVLFAAVGAGRAKVERVHVLAERVHVTTWLVFA